MDAASIKNKGKNAIQQKKADGIADVKAAKKKGETTVKSAAKAKKDAAAQAKNEIKAAGDKAKKEVKVVGDQAVQEIKAAKDAYAAIKNAGDQLKADVEELGKAVEDAVAEVADAVDAAVAAIGDLLGFGAPKGGQSNASASRPFDHRGNFRFRVEIEGIAAGHFKAVDGLSTTVELIEYQGGGDMYARPIPGRPKIAPVTLKKGYIASNELWAWMEDTMNGQFHSHQMTVVLMDDDGQTDLVRYDLHDCWPTSWKGLQLDGMGSEALVEEMELQVRFIKRVAA